MTQTMTPEWSLMKIIPAPWALIGHGHTGGNRLGRSSHTHSHQWIPDGLVEQWRTQVVVAVDTAISRVPLEVVDYHFATFRQPGLPFHLMSVACHELSESEMDAGMGKTEWNELPTHQWVRGSYTPHRDPIGVHAVQFACNNGATSIDLYGYEGWGDDKNWACVTEYQRVMIQQCVEACPEVAFRVHGKMTYALDGSNVEAA